MRDEKEILADLKKARDYNHENAQKMTGLQLAESNVRIKKLNEELNALYTKGASVCQVCSQPPIGMVRKELKSGGFTFNIYEVGCLNCKPVVKQNVETSFSSQGSSPAEAVERWNKGIFLTKNV